MKLPNSLLPPKNEPGFSLVFGKANRLWFIHLWTNQVTTCELRQATPLVFVKEQTYKFILPEEAKLETRGFYKRGVPSPEQRRRAEAEYTEQILSYSDRNHPCA